MGHSKLTSVELFTGAGGLALGIAAAGFTHKLLLEYDRDACNTLRRNQRTFGSQCAIHEGDVRAFDFSPYAGADLLAAGAPCQPFSIGGKHRAFADERNLFPEVFRAISAIKPRAVVIENVKGLLRPSLAEFVEYISRQLAHPTRLASSPRTRNSWSDQLTFLRRAARNRDGISELKYRVGIVLLNAADYGVPQKRERAFFIALRSDVGTAWQPPERTHSESALWLAQEVTGTYWKEHGIKRRVTAGHGLAGRWLRAAGSTEPWVTVRDVLRGLPEPVPERAADGWPNHIGQPGARTYPGHTGSVLDLPAKTIKAGVHGVPGGENMLRRPNGTVRYFTVREAARIQTFPDGYVFTGAWGEAMRQIGNAVPVRLAQAVAGTVRDALQGRAQPLRSRPVIQSSTEYDQEDFLDLLTRSA